MKAIDELIKEHHGIEVMLRVLQAVADKLKGGKKVNVNDLDGILEFLSIFVDKCHHGKEEEFLFPALEQAGVPRKSGPVGIMLGEHAQGRTLVARLKNAVAGYKSGDMANALGANSIINEYVALMSQHITKENAVLFPIANAKLDSNKDSELFEDFEELEIERIGVGKHDEFHALLDHLQDIYLS